MQIDNIDREILSRLRENARISVADLARGLGVSRTTAQSRLERLERSGLIAGYTVRTSEAHEQAQIRAFVMLTTAPRQTQAVVNAAKASPGVRRLVSVSGPFDLIAEVATETIAQMDALIDALGQIDGVERTTSSVVMSVKVDR